MSDLQDQIRRWDQNLMPTQMETLMDAARRVANPDYEVAHTTLVQLMTSDLPMMEVAKRIVNAALGIDPTEDTEESWFPRNSFVYSKRPASQRGTRVT